VAVYEPVLPQNVTEVLSRLLSLFRKAPRAITDRLLREGAELSPDLLSNLRQFGSTPTPRQLQALKLRLSMTTGGVFGLFGYDLDRMRPIEALLNGHRTRIIESYPFVRDRKVDLPQVLAEDRAFQGTSHLSELVLRWQEQVPIRAIAGPYWKRDDFVYAQLGTSDRRASPRIPPRALIAIGPISEQERRNPDPERFYFLQHGEGYICSRCVVRQRRLCLITEDHSDPGPYEFFYPGEVRLVGRVASFAASLSSNAPSFIPARRTHKPAPLILPWEHSSLRALVSAERQRFGIGDAHVLRASQILESRIGSGVSARTLRRYEYQIEGTPRTAVLICLTLIHSLRFTDVLRVLGLWTDESRSYSLESLLHASAFEDLPEVFPTAAVPSPAGRWRRLLEQWGEWPTLLSMAIPEMRQFSHRILRINQTGFFAGLDPLLAPGSLVVLDELKTSPPTEVQRTTQSWCRPIYALRHEGRTLCGYVETHGTNLVLLPHPSAHGTPRAVFRKQRVHVLGQVIAVASAL
jgi:hypothetical protein